MDIKKMRQVVFERTGIRLDDADPVFALVALNEIVVTQLLATAEEGRAQSNAEMDAKIASLVKIYEQIVAASKELVARVDQAHMAAALKAAAEAKAEIMVAARDAIGPEVAKTATVFADSANKLAATQVKTSAEGWTIAILQAVIGGMVAASIVLAATTYIRW
jgi:hypothetical protein